MFGSIFTSRPAISIVRLSGVIGEGSRFQSAMSAKSVGPMIHKAFNKANLKAVALVINSPGGSPVQSDLICKTIRHYADTKKVPVWAFCEDAAASGGYWLACAADRIYASRSSVIGSIGVVSAGFGLEDFIADFGIKRRLHTSGKSKARNDMFSPENIKDVCRHKERMSQIHQHFIDLVSERRAGRLATDNEDLFSGEYWLGDEALGLGLIDGIDDLNSVVERELGKDIRVHRIEPKKKMALSFNPFGSSVSWSDDLVGSAVSAAVEQSMWARFGL